jgi:hypothetical protein
MRALATILGLTGAAMGIGIRSDPLKAIEPDFFPKHKRGKGQNNRRGKGKCSPPKSKPNRLTIGKRVRRKHRRAA